MHIALKNLNEFIKCTAVKKETTASVYSADKQLNYYFNIYWNNIVCLFSSGINNVRFIVMSGRISSATAWHPAEF